jgi:hypothetical protein
MPLIISASPPHALVVNATGVVHVKTVVLLTPEEVDQAAKKRASYRPPGQ